jgi:hypothetical protein
MNNTNGCPYNKSNGDCDHKKCDDICIFKIALKCPYYRRWLLKLKKSRESALKCPQ